MNRKARILALGAAFTLPLQLAQGAPPAASPTPDPVAPSTPSSAVPRAATAGDSRPVTQDQFKELIRVYKRTVDRVDRIDAKIKGGGVFSKGTGNEESVDLTEPPVTTGRGGNHIRPTAAAVPDFRVYFDFNLVSRPGIENLSFDSFHNFLFFEIVPTPEIQFSFEVSTSPRYFELDHQIAPWIQVRYGKIWIPFDDMAPHNIFGGRVNVSRLSVPSAPAFLPDLWTDLGVGVKFTLVDKPKFHLETHAYVVNGFRDGGKDPIKPESGPSGYPSYSDLPISADNNRDKALGGRIHALIAGKLGVGASYYTARWNGDSQPEAKRLNIFGVDTQIRLASTEFRAGLINMASSLPTDQVANRGGAYVEIGQKFGSKSDWKILARGGILQYDDRALDNNPRVVLGDQRIVGGTLLWKPSLIQYSIEYMRDLKSAPNKVNYSFTNLRVVMAF